MTSRIPILLLGLLPATLAAQDDNRLGFAAGTTIAVEPKSYGGSWGSWSMLDDDGTSGWASPQNDVGPHTMVLELLNRTTFSAFEFDNALVDGAGRSAKGVTVEVSDQSATAGFRPVLNATLKDKTAGQRLPVSAQVPARWVRLTIGGNHGDTEYTELMGFKGFGVAERPAPLADVSGAYQTDYGLFHIRQQGSALIGCYEHDEGLLEGTVEGRLMQLTWREAGGPSDRGPAIFTFAPDGSGFTGWWWNLGAEKRAPSGTWNGTKKTSEVGTCPHWSGSVSSELRRTLEADRRAKLYGILFDVDKATIRPESKAVLDEVAALLTAEPSWKLLFEGHTDAEGSEAHNQQLSEARAAAVRDALIARGADAARLRAAGFGETRPVADNSTALGRQQNRRVEVVRE